MITPQEVADALRETLGRRSRLSIFDVELVQSTRGCAARARLGPTPAHEYEVSGLGKTLESAIVELHNAVRSQL